METNHRFKYTIKHHKIGCKSKVFITITYITLQFPPWHCDWKKPITSSFLWIHISKSPIAYYSIENKHKPQLETTYNNNYSPITLFSWWSHCELHKLVYICFALTRPSCYSILRWEFFFVLTYFFSHSLYLGWFYMSLALLGALLQIAKFDWP